MSRHDLAAGESAAGDAQGRAVVDGENGTTGRATRASRAAERRRRLLRLGAAAAAFAGVSPQRADARGERTGAPPPAPAPPGLLRRQIPSSGEALPCVGLGSWITFNVGDDPRARASCAAVIGAFLDGGGRMIDSSPMYGSSQSVIGEAWNAPGRPRGLFAADKVWIASGSRGPAQIERSRRAWRVERFDLLQVHNLLAWESHLPMLFEMKRQSKVRYVGVTTSEGRRHDAIEAIMRQHPIDFVQLSYNALDRDVERRLLPLARERGIAVIANRPFRQGELVQRLAGHRLPPWAGELGCTSWAQLLLKFVLSHPAITCVIPATTRVDHVRENLAAGAAPLPDAALRERLVAALDALPSTR